MKSKTNVQLSIMMFLEFFIWGAWFVTLGTFLSQEMSASGKQIGLAYQSDAIGAILAPFIIGLIADRFFAAQRILGILHIIGAILMYMAYTAGDFTSFYPYIIIYMIAYMPTLALVNAIAFRQMTDVEKQFPRVRVFGTIGWIVAGLIIGFMSWEQANVLENTFLMACGASLLLGVMSFLLPDTPPLGKGQEGKSLSQILGLDALKLLNDKSYLIFFIASILICIPLKFYYNFTNVFFNEIGMEKAASVMTLGQVSEVVFMIALPYFLSRIGLKKTLLFGMLAWVLRYVLFAYGDVGSGLWMLILGVVLHGICYDFFFVAGQIYTDEKAGDEIKSSAQGLITLATYGLGMLIGSYLSGIIVDKYAVSTGHDWTSIWYYPAGMAAIIMILFALTFKGKKMLSSKQ